MGAERGVHFDEHHLDADLSAKTKEDWK